MAELGVNVDHVATIRQARHTIEPDPVWAAVLAELGGADGITVHLREDRRHIQDRDVRLLRETVRVKFNLELSCEGGVLDLACQVSPDQATLVPERREEVTTEGGLDVVGQASTVQKAVDRLREAGVSVSLFIDPDPGQVDAALEVQADAVEFHTGSYALARSPAQRQTELTKLHDAALRAHAAGLTVHAGHGLDYHNVQPIACLPHMTELNIGHSIVSRAVLVGFETAVREMKTLIVLGRPADPSDPLGWLKTVSFLRSYRRS